jgi:hypothetical protein
MAVSSVPPSSGFPTSNDSLLVPLYRKNGIGHGNVISDINVQNQNSTPTPSVDPTGKTGTKVDKKV